MGGVDRVCWGGVGLDGRVQTELRLAGLRQPRAHEYVAEQLRRQITLRLVPPGGVLPPERDLAQTLRIGRATVQQAIAMLEAEGLVERRRGRGGGTFVSLPDTEAAPLERLRADLASSRGRLEEALAFRSEIEPACAAMASSARSAAELADIERAAGATVAAENDERFMQHDTEFHLAVARASHNRFFTEAMERVRLALNDALVALPESPLWHERSHREHAAIVAALRAGAADRARAAMRTHVANTESSVRTLLAALASDA